MEQEKMKVINFCEVKRAKEEMEIIKSLDDAIQLGTENPKQLERLVNGVLNTVPRDWGTNYISQLMEVA